MLASLVIKWTDEPGSSTLISELIAWIPPPFSAALLPKSLSVYTVIFAVKLTLIETGTSPTVCCCVIGY